MTTSSAFSGPAKRSRYARNVDEYCDTSPNLNLGGSDGFLLGFHSLDCLYIALSFLPAEELAANRVISKEAEVCFKKAFQSHETHLMWGDMHYFSSSIVGHVRSVAKHCKNLKKVSINAASLLIDDDEFDPIICFYREIFKNNKNISTLRLTGMPTFMLNIISSLTFPLRELMWCHQVSMPKSPFNLNILTSSGYKLQTLDLHLSGVDLNLHEFIQACPNIEVFGAPRSGVFDEARMTPNDRLHKLTELTLKWAYTAHEVAKLIRRAPNLRALFVYSYDTSLVQILRCFSGESLTLDCYIGQGNAFGAILKILRREGVILPLLRFSTSTLKITEFTFCKDFVAVAPNVNVFRGALNVEGLEALHEGGLNVTCLLLWWLSDSMLDFICQDHVFVSLKHIAYGNSKAGGGIAPLRRRRPWVGIVPRRSHFRSRLYMNGTETSRNFEEFDCEEFGIGCRSSR